MIQRLLLMATLVFSLGCGTKTHNEIYVAGFTSLHTEDSARKYKPGVGAEDYLYHRPLDLDLWYPALAGSADTAILFRQILGLLEERANYYTASEAGNGLSAQIASIYCEGFKCSDTSQLLNFRTQSFKNVPSAEGKFPLVIYFSAYNGMAYENFALFESLAKKGIITVSISSIGRFPGDMTQKMEDLNEQVNDAVFALEYLRKLNYVDISKIGLVGYSWGGLAASIFASKTSGISCLVSLDGSEFHHYGIEKQENNDFDAIRNSKVFLEMRLAFPYLRLESSPTTSPERFDSIYNFSEKLAGNKTIFGIKGARHEDFGCLSGVVRQSGDCPDSGYFNLASTLTTAFLLEQLCQQKNFSTTLAKERNRVTGRD